MQLLQTIPGVGRKTAEVVVAYLDDPHRFQNARQVSSYAGMVPDVISRARWIARAGSTNGAHVSCGAAGRSGLADAALQPWAKSVYERQRQQKTRKKKAIVAVARKLGSPEK